MHPNIRYFHTAQPKADTLARPREGEAKAAARTSKPIADVWAFLQLGAATAVIVAAIVVLTSLAG